MDRSLSLLSGLFSILPVRRACFLLLLPAAVLLLSAGMSQAQTVYGDYLVVGTGADTGISFEFLASQPLLTPGLPPTFSVISCTVPSGETCNQVDFSAAGGQIRLVTTGSSGPFRTWNFPSFLHTGVYIGQTGTGLEPGNLFASGVDATAGQPQSNATDSTFQFPLEVTVNDSGPNYQPGVTVTFTAPGSGPTASLPDSGQATTDSTGRAYLTPTANSIPGAYQITATAVVGGNTFQTSFVATNVNTDNATGACQVTTANDDFSAGSLRYQVAACGKGGTITFASGIPIVNLSVGQDIPLTQDLTIDGGSGVTINANSQSRVFFISGGTITLKNLTLENGTAAGGTGGTSGSGSGGGAVGMGGAIFVNVGSLVIDSVTFTNNQAAGGNGGSVLSGFLAGGGGGVGGPGGTSASQTNGNGGGGGDFGSSGGGGTGSNPNGSGDGAGGGNGGDGAFGGGGSGLSGAAGFGGGGGGGGSGGNSGGTFGGSGGDSSSGGGGAAGLGGAIFMRNGTLSLTSATFNSDSASEGIGQNGGGNGQGKGGALYISSTASAVSPAALPKFGANSAASAGTGTACNTVVGSNALDTNDICGILTGPATHFSVSAPSSATSFIGFSITVTALDANNIVVTGYTGTVQLTSTDPGFVNVTGDSTFTNGVGTFNVDMKQAGTQTITASDSGDGSITGTSNSILVNPGAPAHLVVLAPVTTSSGTAVPFTVTATDVFGNIATNYAGTLHFTSSDASAVLPADSVLTAGTSFFDATLKTPGTQTITATDTVTNTFTGTSNVIAVSIPGIVVTSTADSGPGSLRDALMTAAADGSANITFDPTEFATPQTITLTSGTLNIGSTTTITGPTTGSGATLTNLVTVAGGGSSSDFPIFTVGSGVTGVAITNLTITNGNSSSLGGGGIYSFGAVTVTGCTFSGNSSASSGGGIANFGTLMVSNSIFSGNSSLEGGGIFSYTGTLTVTNSTFSGNSATYGGGIDSVGTMTLAGSTFSGNSAVDDGGAVDTGNGTITYSTFYGNTSSAVGGAIYNEGTLTVTNSTISGNSVSQAPGLGGGIFNQTALTLSNSIVSGNSTIGSFGSGAGIFGNGSTVNANTNVFYNNLDSIGVEDDCASVCTNTHVISGDPMLLPLGNYGGTTQTMLPQPGSAAICSGLAANIPVGVTADQRGKPNSTTYGSTTCTDAGAVQTNYALNFTAPQPSNVVAHATMAPAPIVSISESGSPFAAGSATVSLTDADTDLSASATTSVSTAGGVATFSNLNFTHTETGDTLSASVALNTSLNETALSSPFSVTIISQSITFAPTISSYMFSAGSFAVSATATSGLSVSYASTTAGVCSVSGTTVTILSVGTCTIQATQPGDIDYSAAAPVLANFTINQASQTIAFSPSSPVTYGVSPIALTATGGASSNAVSFSVVSGPGAISGSTLTVTGTGTIVVAANQAGNSNYTAATQVTANIVVNQASQVIAFTPSSPLTYGVSPIPLTATGGASGNAVTFSVVSGPGTISLSTLTVTGAGTIVVTANQAGNSNYPAATQVTANIVVNQASQAIAFTPSSPVTYGVSPIPLTATGGASGNAVTFSVVSGPGTISASTLTATGAGTIVVTANQAGNSNYTSATQITANIVVGKLTLMISANNATKVYGTANPTFTGTVAGQLGGDSFTESFSTSATTTSPAGTYAILATATGTNLSDYTQVVNNGTLSVTKAGTTTALALSSASITPGQNETLTAQVLSSTSGTPTSTVSFYDGTALLSTVTLNGGAASYSTTTLAPGMTHTLTAVYNGDANFTQSSSVSSAIVAEQPLDFTMTLSGPSNLTVVPGQSISYLVQVVPNYGSYAGTVNFAVSGMPPGATVTFSPSSIAANGGPQTITVTIHTEEATALLHHDPPPSGGPKLAPLALALLLLFGAGSLRKRGRALRGLLCVLVFAGAAAAASMMSGCGSTNGFFTQASHNYTMTITAMAGPLSHTTTVTLDVQ